MRAIAEELQSRLDSGATTLCWCFELVPPAGAALRVTDHDRDLLFRGEWFRSEAAWELGDADASAGLAGELAGIIGVLGHAGLSAEALAAGVYDAAQVNVWRVDWRRPDLSFWAWGGRMGAVRRQGARFEAELASAQAALDRVVGRIYARRCDAKLGDARCGVDLFAPGRRAPGCAVIAARHAELFTASGLEGFAAGTLDQGEALWETGANAGRASPIAQTTGQEVRLLAPTPRPIAAGDRFTAIIGCDKSFAVCANRFANSDAFRGFPLMPGNDALAQGPIAGLVNDGGSRFQ